jgi:hypothetical protein
MSKRSLASKLRRICRKIQEMADEGYVTHAEVWATKLWNAIDHHPEPEPLWDEMERMLPAFFGGNTNDFRFRYWNEDGTKIAE